MRPVITYASPILNDIAQTHINKLQVFQNKMLRMILNVPWYTSTEYIHHITNMEKIKQFIQKLNSNFNARLQVNHL